MNSINTNMSALTAQQNMQKQNKELDEAMARLSSGLRINSAADDAAGSAIASKMEAQVRSLDVAIRNSYDAISMTQTVEGALGEMENILQRVRELSVQAANSTLSVTDRDRVPTLDPPGIVTVEGTVYGLAKVEASSTITVNVRSELEVSLAATTTSNVCVCPLSTVKFKGPS